MSDTDHIILAFAGLQVHEPEWERGFLQRTLMVALGTPLARATNLPDALVLLPAHLRGETTGATSEELDTLDKLKAIAEQDKPFLQNFLDGKPCSPFI